MLDYSYSTEEERCPGRKPRRRGAHNISLSSDEEEDEVGALERLPVHAHSDKEERGDADFTEELAAKDVAGPQLSKGTVKEAMKGAKRVDKIAPNTNLNQTIMDHYHNIRWTIRIKDHY